MNAIRGEVDGESVERLMGQMQAGASESERSSGYEEACTSRTNSCNSVSLRSEMTQYVIPALDQ